MCSSDLTSVSSEERKTLIAFLSISVASSAPMLVSVDNIGIAVLSWFNLGLLYFGTRNHSIEKAKTQLQNKFIFILSSLVTIAFLSISTFYVLIPVAKADIEFTRYIKESASSNFSMAQQESAFNSITKLRPTEYRYQVLFAKK